MGTTYCQLSNGDFELGNNNPSFWSHYSWQSAGVSFAWELNGMEGSHCVSINNETSNDSRWVQTIQLVPGKTYLISGYIKGVGISQGAGANLCIYETWTNSGSLYGTFDWKKVQFLYTVPANLPSVIIGCRLGYWGSTVTGKAWFDNIKVEEPTIVEGNHIILSLTLDLMNGVNRQSIVTWVNNLDLAYEKYTELVGDKPYSGSKININPDFSHPGFWAGAGNPIVWNADYINTELKSIETRGDWSFGILHEIGHDFDLDYKWVWNAEMEANFKMVYVNEQLGAKVYQDKVYAGSDIKNYYKLRYNQEIAKGSFSWDAVTFLFTNIVDSISWEPFKKTFRTFNQMPSSEVPKTEYQKFKKFMDLLSFHSGRNPLAYLKKSEFEWIRGQLSKVNEMHLSKHNISLEINESSEISATFLPEDTPDKSIRWVIGDSSVCKIEGNIATALHCGTTYLYATSNEGDFVDSCQISVRNCFTLTIAINPANSGSGTGGGKYEQNMPLTVTASPYTGYDFVNWTENGAEVSKETNYTFTITKDRNLIANFKIKSLDVKVKNCDATSVTLNWTPLPNTSAYNVFRNNIYIGSTISKTGYFSDFGLAPGQPYDYSITAVDANNNSLQKSNIISVITKLSNTIRTHYKVLALAYYPNGINSAELTGLKTYFKHRLDFFKLASLGSAIIEPFKNDIVTVNAYPPLLSQGNTEINYPLLVTTPYAELDGNTVVDLIEEGDIDFVWVVRSPDGYNFGENHLMGNRDIGDSNSSQEKWISDKVRCSRTFFVNQYGPDERCNDAYAHMVEGIMSSICDGYPSNWPRDNQYLIYTHTRTDFTTKETRNLHLFERFRLADLWNGAGGEQYSSDGNGNCGTSHFPPNSRRDIDLPGEGRYDGDYAYYDPKTWQRYIDCYADDWFNYPNFNNLKRKMNGYDFDAFNSYQLDDMAYSSALGFSPEKHPSFTIAAASYHQWWFSHLPHNTGINNGKLNNWWPYIYDFNRFNGSAINYQVDGFPIIPSVFQAQNEEYGTDEPSADNWGYWHSQNGFSPFGKNGLLSVVSRTDRPADVKKGNYSLKITVENTESYENYDKGYNEIFYPKYRNARWNLSCLDSIQFSLKLDENPNLIIGTNPIIKLCTNGGNRIELVPLRNGRYTNIFLSDSIKDINKWYNFSIPISANSGWEKNIIGYIDPNLSPSQKIIAKNKLEKDILSEVNYIEISLKSTRLNEPLEVCSFFIDNLKFALIKRLETAVPIEGLSSVCKGLRNVTYRVPKISGATSYVWTLPAGATGTSTADSISVSFDYSATTGDIKVKGRNSCGEGMESKLTITVNPTYNRTDTVSICEGLSYKGHTIGCIYTETLKTIHGCDSIVTTNLTVNPIYNGTENIAICQGESYKGHTTSGTYTESLQRISGCDSIIVTNLTVIPVYYRTDNINICDGASYKGHMTSGTFVENLTNISGCDSTVTTVLSVNPVYTRMDNISICEGNSFKGHSTNGIYTETLKTIHGCDSTVTTNLTVNPIYNGTENIAICQGESYKGHTTSGTYAESLWRLSGCDSIIVTNLTVTPVYYHTDNISICEGISYKGHTGSGIYIENLQSISGCDSVVTTVLTINPKYVRTDNISICEGNSYKGHSTGGIYVENLQNNNGCDSIVTTNLIVKEIPVAPVISLNNGVLQSNAPSGNQWYYNSSLIQNATNDTYTPTLIGDYYAIRTLSSCSSQPSNMLSYNPTGIIDISSSDKIKVYPNPTSGFIEILFIEPMGSDYQLEIFNLTYKIQTYVKHKNEKIIQIDLSNYPSGIYLMRVSTKNKSYYTRVIKY